MQTLPIAMTPVADYDKLQRSIEAKEAEIEKLATQLGSLDSEIAELLADQATGDAKAASRIASLKTKRGKIATKLTDAEAAFDALVARLNAAAKLEDLRQRQMLQADRLALADERVGIVREVQKHIDAIGKLHTKLNSTGQDLLDLSRGAVDYDRIKDRWTVGQDLLSMLTIALGQAGIPFTKGLSDYQLSQMPDLATRFAERQLIYTAMEPPQEAA